MAGAETGTGQGQRGGQGLWQGITEDWWAAIRIFNFNLRMTRTYWRVLSLLCLKKCYKDRSHSGNITRMTISFFFSSMISIREESWGCEKGLISALSLASWWYCDTVEKSLILWGPHFCICIMEWEWEWGGPIRASSVVTMLFLISLMLVWVVSV